MLFDGALLFAISLVMAGMCRYATSRPDNAAA